jgi:hypothetical protein
LHQVAYRVALRARTRATRLGAREQQGPGLVDLVQDREEADAADWAELRPVLDEALAALPEKYRAAVVLCYLQGKTYAEAARELGCPKGTVSIRLTRAREKLRGELARRGLELPAGLLAAGLCPRAAGAAPPAHLLGPTLKAATGAGAVPARIATLAEGVLRTMRVSKLKMAALCTAAVGLAALALATNLNAKLLPGPAAGATNKTPGEAQSVSSPKSSGWKLKHTFDHKAIVNGVAFGNDLVASCGEDGFVRLWDPQSGKPGRASTPHPKKEPVKYVYFLPNGGQVFAISGTGQLTIWDHAQKGNDGLTFGFTNVVLGLGADHQSLAVVILDTVASQKIDLPDFKITSNAGRIIADHQGKPRCSAFTGDGDRLAVGWDDGAVGVWGPDNKDSVWLQADHAGAVWAVAFSPDNKLLASAGKDGVIRLWDAVSGTALGTLKGHRGGVRAVAFSPDGKRLASAGEDKAVRVWDVVAKKGAAILEGHTDAVTSVAFQRDGRRIVTGSADNSARVWEYKE